MVEAVISYYKVRMRNEGRSEVTRLGKQNEWSDADHAGREELRHEHPRIRNNSLNECEISSRMCSLRQKAVWGYDWVEGQCDGGSIISTSSEELGRHRGDGTLGGHQALD